MLSKINYVLAKVAKSTTNFIQLKKKQVILNWVQGTSYSIEVGVTWFKFYSSVLASTFSTLW